MIWTAVLQLGRRAALPIAVCLWLAPLRLTAAEQAPAPAPTSTATDAPQETTADNVHLPTPEEIRMGQQGVVEVEKEYKLVQDEAQLRRLRTIGDEILRASNDPVLIRAYRE